MPIQLQCPSCRSTLQVPDTLAGRKVRCPKCRGVADVNASPAGSPTAAVPAPASAEDKGSPRFRPDAEEVRVRARKPPPVPDEEVEDAEEVEERPARPVRSPSRRQEGISTRPLRRNEPTDAEDEEEGEAREALRPRRFKRRRRRRRPPKSSSGSGQAWLWARWIVAAIVYIVIGSGIAIHMVATGHVEELILDAISWAVMMPISLVLFFISMFIGSAIAGGIDFGDIRTAIPKAFFLLAPINAFYALFQWYIGFFAAAPFWIFGLMLLFELDIWESWFMVVINWFLNVGANVLTVLIVIAMIHGAAMEKDKADSNPLDDDPIGAAFQMQKNPPKGNQRPGR